ncbi:hypothetical protein TNCV_1696321 [Trichonephila clavipes]|nr:hypothetical protein TNCV_1696321 [Trichonephila clavipes]
MDPPVPFPFGLFLCGPGSLVVKGLDSWLASHEFESNVTENSPCREGRCMLNMSRLKGPPDSVVGKLGEGDARAGIVLHSVIFSLLGEYLSENQRELEA